MNDSRLEMTITDKQDRRVLDLERLSDIFMRAGKEAVRPSDLSEVFFKKTEHLAQIIATEDSLSMAELEDAKATLRQIVLLARDHDIDRVILPFHRHNSITAMFRDSVVKPGFLQHFYKVDLEMSMGNYTSHRAISALGRRDESRSTAFHLQLNRNC
jgi:hypothetical protein